MAGKMWKTMTFGMLPVTACGKSGLIASSLVWKSVLQRHNSGTGWLTCCLVGGHYTQYLHESQTFLLVLIAGRLIMSGTPHVRTPLYDLHDTHLIVKAGAFASQS